MLPSKARPQLDKLSSGLGMGQSLTTRNMMVAGFQTPGFFALVSILLYFRFPRLASHQILLIGFRP